MGRSLRKKMDGGKPLPRRRSVAGVLFDFCMFRFKEDGWRIVKHMTVNPTAADRNLAEVDDNGKTIDVYPHLTGVDESPEKTLLHELLHVGFDIDDAEVGGAVAWLEGWLWPRLTRAERGTLTALLDTADD